jgi:hypothetical protein
MGQNASKQPIASHEAFARQMVSKAPVDVVIERPPLQERAGRPVLNIPNSTLRVIYVDPTMRLDVVPRHGYIALRMDGHRPKDDAESDVMDGGEGMDIDDRQDFEESQLPGRRSVEGGATGEFEAMIPMHTKPSGDDELDIGSEQGESQQSDPFAAAGKGDDGEKKMYAPRRQSVAVNQQSRRQQFIMPVGKMAQQHIFFEDDRFAEDYDEYDGTSAELYAREEEDIYEIAGVSHQTVRPRAAENDDLTYELHSDVLEALRVAIAAPLKNFRPPEEDDDQADHLAAFKSEAMKQIELTKDPFEEAAPEAFLIAAPSIDHQMTRDEANVKAKVKRRKLLHKEVNKWRAAFSAENDGRKPTTEEMHSDPDFGPKYREYVALKKETKAEGDGDEPPSARKEASAAPADTVVAEAPAAKLAVAPVTTTAATPQLMPLAPVDSARESKPVGTVADQSYRALPDEQRGNVKRLVKQMRAWRIDYENMTGVAPTKADMINDHVISDVYMQLRRAVGADDVDISDEEEIGAVIVQTVTPARDSPPPADTAPAADSAARRKELGKRLNAWKEQFAAAHGAKPTNSDILADPAIAAVYEEYKSIPKEAKEHKEGRSRSHSRVDTDAAELAAQAANAEDAQQARRKALGKQLSKWKEHFEATNGRKPTHGDVEGDALMYEVYREHKAIPKAGGSRNPSRNPSRAASPADGPEESPTTGNDEQARRKALGKELNAWKKAFAAEHDRKPTASDIAADAAIAGVYEEYSSIGKGGGSPTPQAEPRAVPTPSPMPIGASSTPFSDDKGAKKRRKQLGKELNAWKQQFAEQNDGRAPTHSDIMADPQIAGVYEEYKAIPKDGESQSAVSAGDAPEATAALRPQSAQSGTLEGATVAMTGSLDDKALHKRRKQLGKELNKWKQQFAEQNDGRAPTHSDMEADSDIMAVYDEYKAIPSAPKADAEHAPPAESPPIDSNAKAQHKRRKALGKELNAWKAQFAEEMGRKPTASDIAADAVIAGVYEEFASIPKGGDDESSHNASRAVSRLSEAPADDATAAAAKEAHKKRKKLGKELNAWKTKFLEDNGRQPTASDIAADATIAAVYEAYAAMPKHGGTEAGGTEAEGAAPTAEVPDAAEHPAGEADAGDAQSSADHARKKLLSKQLNTWKAMFAEQNGHAPKTADILSDPDIAPIYEEFLVLKKAL